MCTAESTPMAPVFGRAVAGMKNVCSTGPTQRNQRIQVDFATLSVGIALGCEFHILAL